MMKAKLLLKTVAYAIACSAVLSACGSDSDDSSNDFGSVSNVNPKSVFTGKLPAQVDGYQVNYDAQGRMTSLVKHGETVTFTYNDGTRASQTDWDVMMKNGHEVFYIRLNKMGFAKDVLETDSEENESETWKYEYNAQGQLTYMYRSEGKATTRIEYSNGDITKVREEEPEEKPQESIIFYTNATYKTVVENKGCIMLFDDMFQIDMDEMEPAYYAGLLGRATKHLPVSYKDDEGTWNFVWKFDDNGYPTYFQDGDSYSWEATYFSWK